MVAPTAALALAADAGALGPALVVGEITGAPPDVVRAALELTTDPAAADRIRARADDGADLLAPAPPLGILGS
jgi:hypothetical protein